ncbi:Hypothetical protein, putative [Bodo saltans]|uniref:Uncharacterized protein n=1 Tax=Bodo saltans TaxID=75058 RepID=A0A0S4IXU0_BODSA|nr:Hypothetical protein, putative [Bodo saltans]|eukprot:CUG09894.1 Hypothetical protein, putative [Bodo saltans]
MQPPHYSTGNDIALTTAAPTQRQHMTLDDAKRRLAAAREDAFKPLPKLESMVRAQRSIDSLREITKSMRQLVPPQNNNASDHNKHSSQQQLRYGSSSSSLHQLQQEPLIPPDKAAFLQVLERKALADEDLKEKYERMQQQRAVASLHLSSQATPPTGEYAQVLQSKVDPFKSNAETVHKIVSLTPRSLAKQHRAMSFSGNSQPRGASPGSPRGDDDDEQDEDDEKTKMKKSNSNMRSLADSLANTKTDDLLEKSIVLQASKQDFQGNLSLKKAVQLAMAAQHAQQVESMKRTFELRLNEAIKGAREEGLIRGRKEGSDNARAQLCAQEVKIEELEQQMERLQAVATQSYVEKETTVTKVHFVRDERDKCVGLLRKYEDVEVDEVLKKATLYEHERDYLYAKAFRSVPDWEPQLFANISTKSKYAMHPSTAQATTTHTFRSPRGERAAARQSHRHARVKHALVQLLKSHESLAATVMALVDVNANIATDAAEQSQQLSKTT